MARNGEPGNQRPARKGANRDPLRHRIAAALFPDVIDAAAREAAAAVTVRIDESAGWQPLHPQGPHDRDLSEWMQDQEDALKAWRKNFQVRRIVTLTRSYVLGGGITLSSQHAGVNRFLQDFIHHPKNQLYDRLGPICDELTRAGEIFPILFTNPADGMSYLRFMPASQIREIETAPDDYEIELAYISSDPAAPAGKTWLGADNAAAWEITGSTGRLPPLMLHYTVNKPIGATRGEGDLTPILRWALRYSSWLEDRVRLNRVRTRQQLLEIKLADDTAVKDRKRQVETEDPVRAGIYVHGPGEEVLSHKLDIGAGDAAADGKALRLAVAAGANSALHYMGEGESANYATAREMGEPTARFYTERQQQLCGILKDLLTMAYRRKVAQGLARPPQAGNYKLQAAVTETARADNSGLAEAARNSVEAFAHMRALGWIDDETAITLAFKFAGEAISAEEVAHILATVEPTPAADRIPRTPAGPADTDRPT